MRMGTDLLSADSSKPGFSCFMADATSVVILRATLKDSHKGRRSSSKKDRGLTPVKYSSYCRHHTSAIQLLLLIVLCEEVRTIGKEVATVHNAYASALEMS